MAEGRLGHQFPISGYVIAQDRSFGARAGAGLRKGRYRALRLVVQMRGGWRDIEASSVKLASFMRSRWARIAACGPSQVGLSAASRIGVSVVLLRHLFTRDDRTGVKPGNWKQRHARFLGVGVVAAAFAAAIFLPERIEPVQTAEAATSAELKPVLVGEPVHLTPSPFASASLAAAPAQWQPLRKPMAMYHLESPDLTGLELSYRVSMRGASRQDSLIWLPKGEGAGDVRRALAQITIERHEGNQTTERPLFADLAARAAEQHLVVERMARPREMRTKFGALEAAESTFRQDGKALSCIGFRRIDMTGLTFVGWVCGSAQKPVDRVSLACFIDRLDLIGGGRDASLRKAFAEAERARIPCSSSRQSGKRLTWLDHESPVPDLKLSSRTR